MINNKVLFVIKELDFSGFAANRPELERRYFLYRKGILELLAEFFETNPEASLEEVKKRFADLKTKPQLVSNSYVKSREGKVAFTVDGYADVSEWANPATIIPPDSPIGFQIGRSSGQEVEQWVEYGKSMVVVFLALEYQGIDPAKKFRYFFLGFDNNGLGQPFKPPPFKGYPRILQSFKEWSTRDTI